MSIHKEISFEMELCDSLASQGWLYAEGDAAQYDRARALFPADLVAWVQETQPDAWEALSKSHGAAAEALLIDRVRHQINRRGTLDVKILHPRCSSSIGPGHAVIEPPGENPRPALTDAHLKRRTFNRMQTLRPWAGRSASRRW